MTLELSTLGSVALRDEANHLLPGRRKVLAVLAYLAHVENPVSRRRLASQFWPGSPEARAKQSLRQALSELRTAVGDALQITPDEVALRREGFLIDSQRFLQAVQGGQWSEALAQWQGDFLSGFEDVGDGEWRDWLASERAAYTRELHRAREASGELAVNFPAASAGPVAPGTDIPRSAARDFSLGLLGTLSTDARAVVEAAAVIGTRSAGTLLRHVTSLSPAGFASAMAELTERGMLVEAGDAPGCYDFAAATTRLRIYQVTAAYRRQSMHSLVSEALASGIGPDDPGGGRAADHARLATPEPEPTQGWIVMVGVSLAVLIVLAGVWYFLR